MRGQSKVKQTGLVLPVTMQQQQRQQQQQKTVKISHLNGPSTCYCLL